MLTITKIKAANPKDKPYQLLNNLKFFIFASVFSASSHSRHDRATCGSIDTPIRAAKQTRQFGFEN